MRVRSARGTQLVLCQLFSLLFIVVSVNWVYAQPAQQESGQRLINSVSVKRKARKVRRRKRVRRKLRRLDRVDGMIAERQARIERHQARLTELQAELTALQNNPDIDPVALERQTDLLQRRIDRLERRIEREERLIVRLTEVRDRIINTLPPAAVPPTTIPTAVIPPPVTPQIPTPVATQPPAENPVINPTTPVINPTTPVIVLTPVTTQPPPVATAQPAPTQEPQPTTSVPPTPVNDDESVPDAITPEDPAFVTPIAVPPVANPVDDPPVIVLPVADPVSPDFSPIRIDAGSMVDTTDALGNVWSADRDFVFGTNLDYNPALIAGGSPFNALYGAERCCVTGYALGVPNGTYRVALHFVELYETITQPGQRIFDITVEDKASTNFDLFETAGFGNPVVMVFDNVEVIDNQIDITLPPRAFFSSVSAIEVVAAGQPLVSEAVPTIGPENGADPTCGNQALSAEAIAVSFEQHAPGISYNRTAQQVDWTVDTTSDGAMEAASTITTAEAICGPQSLEIEYPANERRLLWGVWDIPPRQEYYLSYWLLFEEGFQFDGSQFSGGKLPGLAGAGGLCSGGDTCNGSNGFTARYMWREQGSVVVYLYHMDKPGQFGEDLPLIGPDGNQLHFQPGTWHNLVQRVRINTPGNRDGELDVWMDGEQALSVRNLRFATNGMLIDKMYFSTFFGGSGPGWYPNRPVKAYYDGFVISPNAADVGVQ